MIQLVSPSLVAQRELDPGNIGPDDLLCHARIGYQTMTRNATVAVSSSAAGFPADSLKNSMTYDRWRPESVPAYVAFNQADAVEVDYIGIAGHNLYSVGAMITVQHSNNGVTWSTVAIMEPSRDGALMIQFEPVTAKYWRVSIDGGIPTIAVIYFGKVLVMQRGNYGGHSPGTLSRITDTMPNKSDTGQFLGRSIIRQGYGTSYAWSNLTANWYRQYFDPFVESARKYPFFIQWFPEKFPDEVLYAWTDDNISPSNMGVRDLMSVGFSVQALG